MPGPTSRGVTPSGAGPVDAQDAPPGVRGTSERSTAHSPDWPPLTLRVALQAVVTVLPWWIGSRLVAGLALLAAEHGWTAPGMSGEPRYGVWDVGWFLHIAQYGYGFVDAETAYGAPAFMPLMPFVMRWGGVLTGSPLLAGGIAANVGALIGAAALYHLTRMGLVRGRPGSHLAGVFAAAFLLMSPFGLPLFLAYTEPLLLAVAVPAWIAARRQVWWLAGVLASVGVLARVTGVSVGFGIGVMWLIACWPRDGARGRAAVARWLRRLLSVQLLWVVLPLLTYLAWTVRLYQLTGRWDAVAYAQRTMWFREVVPPWEGLRNTVDAFDAPLGYIMKREFAATLVVVVLVVVLLWRRMWPESAFVGSACLVLLCSSLWGSSIRGLTVMFPFWMLVGGAAAWLAGRGRNGSGWVWMVLALLTLGLFWVELLIANGAFVV
ncbi:hypothetical protein [Nakamurella deserti]|uniref:hypothetical protein n=1 Tax=Nakamurella deserti TaxID=2164074 RepID=UPI000DBE3C28|nr:hypothetical protein [Nakamurella deserti]